jgi:hypothetical protein
MKNMYRSSVLFVLLSLILLGGCNRGPKRPDGFPKLYPCKITITQGGTTPLEGATVTFVNKAGSIEWSTGGRTDANGIAEIKTAVNFSGVPEGEYSVRVSKNELSPSSVADVAPTDPIERLTWDEARRAEVRTFYRYVKPEFDDITKTPHSITIGTSGSNDVTFDVGEAIQEVIKSKR